MEQHDYIVLLEKFFKKEASSEERRILIEWIRKPGIRNEFNLLCEQMWKEAAVEIDKTVEEEMWNHLQRNLDEPKILSPKKRRWQPIIYKVVATILLPVCLGLATYFGVEHMNKVSQDPFMVAVDYGQKANLTLPDGTKVWLNSATHLSYDAEYNKSDRKIYLDGEAYFEVTKNRHKPFTVESDAMRVRVLGTTFNFKCDKRCRIAEATLIEGEIEVKGNKDEGQIVLAPGQRAELNRNSGRLTVKQVDAKLYAVWRDNLIPFNKANIFTITKALERFYDVKIILSPDIRSDKTYSGVLKKKSTIESVLKSLQNSIPIEYKIVGNNIFISSDKK